MRTKETSQFQLLDWFFAIIIFILPFFIFPWLRQSVLGAKQILLYLILLAGFLIWAISLFKSKKIVFRIAVNEGWLWLFILWGTVSWFLAPRGIKIRSLLELNPWANLLVIAGLGFVFSQTNLVRKRNKILTILSLSGVILTAIAILLFLIPENKFPLRIPPNNPFFTILNNSWSPIGSNLGLLLFSLPLLIFWFQKLIRETGKKEKLTFEKKVALPAFFAFVFIIGIGLVIYQLAKNRPLLLNFYTSWTIAVESLKRSPLLGTGPNNFLTGFSLYRPIEFNQTKNWQILFTSPANLFFQIWTELGLIALIFWLLFNLKVILAAKSKKSPLFSPLVSLFLIQLFTPLVFPTLFLFLILSYLARGQKVFVFPQIAWVKKIIAGLVAVLVVVLGFLLTKALVAEYWFIESVKAINKNEANKVYLSQQKAILSNPFVLDYRISRSQTNLALANSLSRKENITDDDKRNIAILIQEAISEAKAAVALEPRNVIAWQNLSQTYRQLINLAQDADQWTISAYQQTIALNPFDPNLRIDLGGIFFSLNRFEDAAKLFEIAVNLKPDHANAWYNWAWALKNQNKTQEAVEKLQQALNLVDKESPDYEKAKNELDKWSEELGKELKATPSAQPRELSLPTPIPSPKIQPIELPEEAAPQIEITPSPAPEASPTPVIQ